MKETPQTENVLKKFNSIANKPIANKLVHAVAWGAIVPFLPLIAVKCVVALSSKSTEVAEASVQSFSPASDFRSDSQILSLNPTA